MPENRLFEYKLYPKHVNGMPVTSPMCHYALQDPREREDSARLRSLMSSGSGVDSGSITSADSLQRRPHRMLETWIICELCNAGNLQDAVMLREDSVFFEGDTPQMVSHGQDQDH